MDTPDWPTNQDLAYHAISAIVHGNHRLREQIGDSLGVLLQHIRTMFQPDWHESNPPAVHLADLLESMDDIKQVLAAFGWYPIEFMGRLSHHYLTRRGFATWEETLHRVAGQQGAQGIFRGAPLAFIGIDLRSYLEDRNSADRDGLRDFWASPAVAELSAADKDTLVSCTHYLFPPFLQNALRETRQ